MKTTGLDYVANRYDATAFGVNSTHATTGINARSVSITKDGEVTSGN